MGDRVDRVRAWRGVGIGIALAVLTLIATAALAVAIPTQGENPGAWGVIVCGVLTLGLCVQLARRNWHRIRHYRGDDLPLGHQGARNRTTG
jgi:hypothetical protein